MKPSLTSLKKHLRQQSDKELVEEIAHLYKTFPQVKEYYQASFFKDDAGVLDKYKQIVIDEFSPTRGKYQFPKMRASVARKAISDYKKIACSDAGIADIMLTYVESGVDCTLAYGDIDEPFYISMESMYESAWKFIAEKALTNEFSARLKAIVTLTRGMGWGFHDQLSDIYAQYAQEALTHE